MTSPLANALIAELVSLPDEALAPLLQRLEGLLSAEAPPPASPLMTAQEAATYLRADVRRVYDLIADGRLTRQGDGRRLLISRIELEKLARGR